MSTPPPVNCYRCGQPGFTDWIDITSLGGQTAHIAGEQYCLTDGCTDEDGSRRLVALTPEDLRRRADAAFMARHKALVEDR